MMIESKIKKFCVDLKLEFVMPNAVTDIPQGTQLVYILAFNNKAIVIGEGNGARARVIFDDIEQIRVDHFKSTLVRMHHLFKKEEDCFVRCLVVCKDKKEAREVERQLHRDHGGNTNSAPPEMLKMLLEGLAPNSPAAMILNIMLVSSYSGLSDLRKWIKEGIVCNETKEIVFERLRLAQTAYFQKMPSKVPVQVSKCMSATASSGKESL